MYIAGGLILALAFFVKVAEELRRERRKDEKKRKLRSEGKGYDFTHEDPDRWFSRAVLREGHVRAGHQCEYTDTRTNERCVNRSREGDHFFPYSKGGASTQQNMVSSCRWHNQWKRDRILYDELPVIEERRRSYFPAGVSVCVGEMRDVR